MSLFPHHLGEAFWLKSLCLGDDILHRNVYTAIMIIDNPIQSEKKNTEHIYQIQILGEINQARMDWFSKMGFDSSANDSGDPITTISGVIVDQSHLRGTLNKIWDLNFEVILVKRADKKLRYGRVIT